MDVRHIVRRRAYEACVAGDEDESIEGQIELAGLWRTLNLEAVLAKAFVRVLPASTSEHALSEFFGLPDNITDGCVGSSISSLADIIKHAVKKGCEAKAAMEQSSTTRGIKFGGELKGWNCWSSTCEYSRRHAKGGKMQIQNLNKTRRTYFS